MPDSNDIDEKDTDFTAIHRNRKTRRYENSLKARKRRRKIKILRMSKLERSEE